MLATLLTLGAVVQFACAQGITRPFLNRTDINDVAFNAYGMIEGETSWIRNGFGAEADLDLTLQFTITNSPNPAFNAINDYQIIVFLSHNETSSASDYIKINSIGSRSSIRDNVNVATYPTTGWKDLDRKVGQTIPVVNAGLQSYSYRITGTSAITSSKPTPTLWALD